MLLWEDHRLRKARSEDELRRDVERMQLEQLIGEGKALRQADEIRAYVSSVVDRPDAVPITDLTNGLTGLEGWPIGSNLLAENFGVGETESPPTLFENFLRKCRRSEIFL